MALKAQTNPDSELLETLTGDNGCLAAGVMPGMELGDVNGLKNLCSAVAGGEAVKIKSTKKPKGEKAEPIVPSTLKEFPNLIGTFLVCFLDIYF